MGNLNKTMSTATTQWKEKTLGELVAGGEYEIRNNLREPLSSSQRSKMQGQYSYYGAAGAIDSISEYRFEGLHLLVAEDGTVFDGSNPMLQLVSGKFWVSNHAHVLRGKDEAATRRLYYFLRNVNVSPYVTGAVQPKLSKENLFRIFFPYPDNEEEKQNAVAAPISLDDKIELLRKQNETLEQIAQAIFNEQFASKTANGKLPQGWKMRKVGDILSLEYGKSLTGLNRKSGNYPVVGSSGVVGYHDNFLVQGAGIVIGRKGTVGTVMWIENSFFPIDTTFYVKDKLGAAKLYYHYYLLRSLGLNKIGSHSAVPGLSRDAVYVIAAPIPTKQAIDDFSDSIEPLYNRKNLNNRQINTLSAIRDALLPKLVGGELRVAN
jgi:type I restriction enzyme, S subunit